MNWLSIISQTNGLWQQKGKDYYVTTKITDDSQLRAEVNRLAKNYPNRPFLISAIFGQISVQFYSIPSRIPVDTPESRFFESQHGFHGYYLNSMDNPQKQGRGWVNRQIQTDNATGAE